jgi:uncharacterized protein YbbK (DUF523 family)
MEKRVLISACLLGEICRYDGSQRKNEELITLLKALGLSYVTCCPEVLGGMPTPRPASQIVNGDGDDVLSGKSIIIDETGRDVTESFVKGAKEALELSLKNNIKKAVLKERSPSCGVNYIYNDSCVVKGLGVTTALFKKNGIDVVSDEDFVSS